MASSRRVHATIQAARVGPARLPEKLVKMAGLQVLLICLVVTIFPSVVHGYIEGLYCGIENCYERKLSVFGVSKVAFDRLRYVTCTVMGDNRVYLG